MPHQRVVVVLVVLGVEPVTPPEELLLEPEPVAPMELVPEEPLPPDEPLLLVEVSLLVLPLPLLPAVLLPDGLVLDEPVAPVPPAVPAPWRLHALRERAATTANVAAATWVRDVFMGTPNLD